MGGVGMPATRSGLRGRVKKCWRLLSLGATKANAGLMRSVLQALAAVLVVSVAPLALAQPAPLPAAPRPAPPGAATAAAPAGTAAPAAGGAAQGGPIALAQAAPTATSQGAPTSQGAGDAKGAAAAGTADAAPKPPAIDVDDPLLAPVPAASNTFAGFREVLTLLSNESLTLRIAQQDIQRAEGQRRVALAATLPSLNASAQASVTPLRPDAAAAGFPQTFASQQLSLGLSVPLSPRAWYAVGTNDKAVEASKLRVEDARRTAIAAAANAIVAVVTAERVAEINRVGLRAALQRLELTKRRKRLGSGTDLDIVRAEQDAASARSQIVSGDENLRRSRESLGQLFGKSDGYGVPTTFTLNDIEPALKSACKPAKSDERADVLAAKMDVKVAERGLTDVKLGFAPSAELRSSLSTSSNTFSTESTAGETTYTARGATTWSITGVLTIPIWDGGARYGQMKTASANIEQAKTRVEQATVTATVEANQSQRAITVAEQAKTVSEKSRDLARETARLSQVAFESGAGTSLDLVDSGRVLRQAELDLAVRELEVVRAKIAALLALSACKL